MTTPYTHSRARVLRAYRRLRENGATPMYAILAIQSRLHREMSQAHMTERYLAEREWDLAHARRYEGWIKQKSLTSPWWGGRVKA